MSRRRRLATVLALCTVLTAGCGSGGSEPDTGASPTPTTAAPATTVTTRPAPSPAADRAAAQRILFTAADVPGMPEARPTNFVPIYARCGKNPLLPGGDDPRQATPLGFLEDETVEVRRLQTTALGAYAVLAPTEAAARSAIGTLRSRDFRACLEREFTAAVDALVAGTPVTQAATADLPTPALGDEAVAFRITLTRGSSRQDFELTAVRKGRGIASLVVGRLGSVPYPDDDRLRLARLLAGRMP